MLLPQNKLRKGDKWEDIIDGYVKLVKHQSDQTINLVVVFDSYESLMKDYTHRRRQNHFSHKMKINQENRQCMPKEKFLSNNSNKAELITKFAEGLSNVNITMFCCREDTDTAVMKESLQHSLLGAAAG